MPTIDISQLLPSLENNKNHNTHKPPVISSNPEIVAMELRHRAAILPERHTFEVGMIVRQKSNMGFYREYNGTSLAIVLEKIDPPISARNTDEFSGTNGYRLLLDLVIGVIDDDGDFNKLHVDSRWYEPAPVA